MTFDYDSVTFVDIDQPMSYNFVLVRVDYLLEKNTSKISGVNETAF